MFPYSDPVGTGRLQQEGDALLNYRAALHGMYVTFARLPNSGFVLLDAFEGLSEPDGLRTDSVSWIAFPLTTDKSDEQIDVDRFDAQDEYVEWHVERDGDRVVRVTFTTEFPEYYEALAAEGMEALVRAVGDVYEGAAPTAAELFGASFSPTNATPDARAAAFQLNKRRNPWNNGTKGILCLAQGANALHALFNLVGRCAVPTPNINAADMCQAVATSGACGPARASDPAVCTASQTLARQPRALSLADPAGIRITSLSGIWKINGRHVDINDPAVNDGAWQITRNGRRAVLEVSRGVTVGDDPVLTGAQVARSVNVSADVISAPDAVVPAWARLGQESSRNIV